MDGCEKRCAARATELHSGKPAASIVVSDLVAARGFPQPQGLRSLDAAGLQAVEATAELIALKVDEFLGKTWSRREGVFSESGPASIEEQETVEATCACASGIPVQTLIIDDQKVSLVALPLIFEQFRDSGKEPEDGLEQELLEMVRVYNPIPDGADTTYVKVLLQAYEEFLLQKEAAA